MSKWMIEYDRLDDDQKDFVDHKINDRGNIWIQGFAGSGKSIMLIHALKKKLRENSNSKGCIVVFTHSLIDMFRTGMDELGMHMIPVMTYHQFMRREERYDFIFCDEVQDLPANVLTRMNSKGNHVYVAGDSNQSIFENTVNPSEIGSILNAKPFELTRIYRLTRSIMSAVTRMLPNLNIFGAKRDMTRQDVSIRLSKGANKDKEVKYIWEQSSNAASGGYTSAVLLPRHSDIQDFANRILKHKGKNNWQEELNQYGRPDYSSLNSHFSREGIKMEYIGNGYGSLKNASSNGNVIIMTYHSAKGLDFDNVFVPYMSNDLDISKNDPGTLLMVALTRSKMNLFITYSGQLNYLVQKFENDCQKITLDENSNKGGDVDFDW